MKPTPRLPSIAILAPGLLGASIGAASHARGLAESIRVWARRQETLDQCAQLAWCDFSSSVLEEVVADADLVWICSPVDTVARLVHAVAPFLKTSAVVSDVGSTKAMLVRQCEQAIGHNAAFVGSHPMAGSEKSGLENADATLFQGRFCFVTPTQATSDWAVAAVEDYWQCLGMTVSRVSPEEHDRIAAWLSHLPHLTASALASTLSQSVLEEWKAYAGPGLMDTTRVAAGNVSMWRDIIMHNRESIVHGLALTIAEMEHLKAHLETGRWDAVVATLEQGREFRRSLDALVCTPKNRSSSLPTAKPPFLKN